MSEQLTDTGFVRVCRLDDLPAVGAALAEIEGRRVAIVRDDDGDVHGVDDTCTHADVSLSEGEVDGCTLECWLHGSRFDLRTGEPTGPPAITPIAVYTVRIEGDDVFVARVTRRAEHCMSTLEIKRPARHRRHRGGRQGDPARRRPDHPVRRDPRHHGPQRLGQVDAGLLDRRVTRSTRSPAARSPSTARTCSR